MTIDYDLHNIGENKKEKMIIKTKEDFAGKFIELPKNIGKKKFNKIKAKFERLGFKINCLDYDDSINIHCYIYFSKFHNSIGNWSEKPNLKQISIKDFLREEEFNILSDNSYHHLHIPKEHMVFCGTDLREIKEDVDRTIQGFSYGKPKKFDNIIQGLNWCFINPMKEIAYETSCSGDSRTRYNEEIDSFENYNKELEKWIWNSYYRTSSPSLWRNIREYRPTKIPLGEVIKKGLRFRFKGESWRKSPQGFILDSKGNSLKSSVLLNNINTEVEIL